MPKYSESLLLEQSSCCAPAEPVRKAAAGINVFATHMQKQSESLSLYQSSCCALQLAKLPHMQQSVLKLPPCTFLCSFTYDCAVPIRELSGHTDS